MATGINNNDVKHYFKEIRTLLPLNGEPEKRFLSDLESSIMNYLHDNPSCDTEELYEQFGSPSEVVLTYLDTLKPENLHRRMTVSKNVKRAILVIVVIAVIVGTIWSFLFYKGYSESRKHYIDREVTVIEEG